MTTLSGGERRRVALCRLLLSSPDLLLLDEPTNHLDAESVAWLERFLEDYKGTVMAVTHDRYFLDNVAGWILELDRGKGLPFQGNYSSWLEQKQERLAQEEKTASARRRTLARELEWVRMSPRARHAKSKARLAAYEKLLAEDAEFKLDTVEIHIPAGPRLGDVVVEAEHVAKGFGDRLLVEDMSFSLPPGGIVGVIGPNGAGKTTLFRMIAGEEEADSGELRIGDTVELAYVDQSRGGLEPQNTVWKEISGNQDTVLLGKREVNSRQYVSWFNFRGGDQQKLVKDLSGGERNRVHLAKLLKSGGNVLLLDEPTNDLDVDTLRALEEALLDFAGCAVVITHDRWFLDRVATHILAFEGDSQVTWFEGSWGEYAAWVIETRGAGGARAAPDRVQAPRSPVIDLPVADPGRPDTRSPVRLLLWVGRQQLSTIAIAISFGIVWMVSQALMPYAIGQAIQQGIVEGDNDELARFCALLAVLGVMQALSGIMRHRYAVQNWLQASYRLIQVVGYHSARSGDALRGELSTGEVVATVSNDALRAGGAFDILARLSRRDRLLCRRRGDPARDLAEARAARPHRGAGPDALAQRRDQAAAGASAPAAGGGRPADRARGRHRSRAPHPARRGRRAGVLQPLPRPLGRGAARGRACRRPAVDARRGAGAAARPLRRARHLGGRAPRRLGRHHARRARLVLRLRRIPRDPAAHLGRGRGEDDARRCRRAEDAPGARGRAVVAEPTIRSRSRRKDFRSSTRSPVSPSSPALLTCLVSASPEETLLLADRLGRLVEPCGVLLGETPLDRLPLEVVRRRILVSEPDPLIFSGTLRSELDPWSRSSDSEITDAIEVAPPRTS